MLPPRAAAARPIRGIGQSCPHVPYILYMEFLIIARVLQRVGVVAWAFACSA